MPSRDDLPPRERAVSDALDELNGRMHGLVSSWAYPEEFLEFLAEHGYAVTAQDELNSARAVVARVRRLHFQYRGVSNYDSCAHCNRYAALSGIEVQWPCDTIKALNGEDSHG